MVKVNIVKEAVNKVQDTLQLFECGRSIGIELKLKRGCGFCHYYRSLNEALERFEFFKMKYGLHEN